MCPIEQTFLNILTSFRTFVLFGVSRIGAQCLSIFTLHFNNEFEAHESNQRMRADLSIALSGHPPFHKDFSFFFIYFFKKKKKALPRTRSRTRCNAMTILVCTLTLGGDHKNLRCHWQDRDRANNAWRRGRQIRSHSRRR